jgi:lipopolysaccharide transport system permease protein
VAERRGVTREFLSELWRYRELLYFFAWRDVKIRYKQAILGAGWAILQPLFTMIVFTLFFGHLAGISTGGTPYPLFSFCGLLAWMYFSATISQGGNSLISNSNLLTKVQFPRLLLPTATAVAGLLDFAVGLVFLIAMMIYYGTHITWLVLIAPLFLLLMVILAMGASMLLGAMNVRFRDVKYTIPFLLQLWLFLTPIIYPVSFVPPRYQGLLALNPMTGIVEGLRASLLSSGSIDWGIIARSCVVTLAIFALGLVYFRKTERVFADIV